MLTDLLAVPGVSYILRHRLELSTCCWVFHLTDRICVHAQSVEPPEKSSLDTARQLMRAGKELYGQGDHAAAHGQYLAAYAALQGASFRHRKEHSFRCHVLSHWFQHGLHSLRGFTVLEDLPWPPDFRATCDGASCVLMAVTTLAVRGGDQAEEGAAMRSACRSTLARCCIKLRRWEECMTHCSAALDADPEDYQAWRRRGQVRGKSRGLDWKFYRASAR